MKKIIVFIIVLAATTGVIIYRPSLERVKTSLLAGIAKTQQAINTGTPQDLLPPPLRTPHRSADSVLIQGDVIKWTNVQRANNGELGLAENSQLNQAAALKLQDMFAQQYFEHVSPSGVGPSDLAKTAVYKYILVGENLALGDFKDSQALVEAWMNSPGHRANILHKRFQEIGVAVGRGEFQGETVWLAVQEFGTPLSSCPQIDSRLQSQITSNNNQIKVMQRQLEAMKQEIENDQNQNKEAYRRRVEDYNNLVKQYNNLIDKTKQLVSEYNAQVNAFNKCVSG